MTNVASYASWRWWNNNNNNSKKKKNEIIFPGTYEQLLFLASSTHWLLAHYSFIIAHWVVKGAGAKDNLEEIRRWRFSEHQWNCLFYKFFNYTLKWSIDDYNNRHELQKRCLCLCEVIMILHYKREEFKKGLTVKDMQAAGWMTDSRD